MALQKRLNIELSFCLYSSAANKPWLWDISALTPHVDHVVIMAYDFHRSSSSVAGPVAPVFGGKEHWDSDIVTHLKEFTSLVPPEKIILGVPFYGYEWETTSGHSRASVFPGTGSTASYNRVQELLKNQTQPDIQEHWDELALSPYLTFTQNNRSHVIYYENQRSLSYKLDLVRDLQLGGVAIWALGYESESREPWDVIQQKFQ
jgi:spore germination protein